MTKGKKAVIIISCILGFFLFIGSIIFVVFMFINRILNNGILDEVENFMVNSSVLKREIGEIDSLEHKFFPTFNFKYVNGEYEAILTYEVNTKDGEEYTIIVYVDSIYEDKVYAYRIKDKMIYEKLYFEEK